MYAIANQAFVWSKAASQRLMHSWLRLIGLLLPSLFLLPGIAQAQTCIAFPGTTAGVATVISGTNEIQLTPDLPNKTGAWWAGSTMDLGLSTTFAFKYYLGAADAGGEGIALVFRKPTSSTLAARGAAMGYGLGVDDNGLAVDRIIFSIMVELDTNQTGSDPAEDHIALTANGNINHNLVSPVILPNREDDAYHLIQVSWNAVTKTLRVSVDGTLRIDKVVDIAAYLGTTKAAWGFTGATGTATNLQKVCLNSVPLYADLSLTAVASNTAPLFGTNTTFTLTAANAPGSSTSNATVRVPLPSGLTFVSAVGSGTYTASTGMWSAGNLTGGASASIVITATANSAVGVTTNFIGEITTGTFSDPDSTPNNGVAGEDDYFNIGITTAPNIVNCPTGSAATGSGYAASGTSALINQIFWLDWSCGSTTQFKPGDTVNKSWTVGDGLTINGQITAITNSIAPYTVGTLASDSLQLRHAGVNPIGLRNVTSSQDPSFTLTLNAALNSSPIALRYVLGDAEDSAGSSESIVATTNGGAWQTLESSGSINITRAGTSATIADSANAGAGTAAIETTASTSTAALGVTLNSNTFTAAAFGAFIPLDYSDAPLTGTSYGAAWHRSIPGMRLGPTVTSETTVYNSPTASGDSDDGLSLPFLFRGEPGTINVSAIGPGKLNGWVDFNGDGDFADSGEQVASDVTDGGAGDSDNTANAVIALPVSPPVSATATPTFARFRWSSMTGAASSGMAEFGEVEDFQLSVISPLLTVSKTSMVVLDPTNIVASPKAIPGAAVRYCVLITNTGNSTANTVSITDALPAQTDYVAESMASGTSCTTTSTAEDDDAAGADESDPIGASRSGSIITGTATNLAAGASFALAYVVVVQ